MKVANPPTFGAPTWFLYANWLLVLMVSGCASTNRPAPPATPAAPALPEARVTGIGGIFFKAQNPARMSAWYHDHLGLASQHGYADFTWRERDQPDQVGHTAWSLFPTNTTYFGQSSAPYMINYRVTHMDQMIAQLRRDGIAVEKGENTDYGRFAWLTDPEGNRIELWEPKVK